MTGTRQLDNGGTDIKGAAVRAAVRAMKPAAIRAMVCAVAVVGLGACTTARRAPQAIVPQWVYAGPAIVLKRNGQAPGDATATLNNPVSAAAALRYFNAKRAEVGLPPLRDNAEVRAAAIAHARYMQTNHTFGHNEMVGAPAFTGTDVTARIAHQRRGALAGASEVVSMQSNGRPESDAVAQLFASPYHRGVILFDWLSAGAAVSHDARDADDVDIDDTGYATDAAALRDNRDNARTSRPGGRSSTEVAVVDFADFGQSIASNELIAYPFDGQSDAPVAWIDDELPDPMGDDAGDRGRVLGYPITLSGGPNAHIALQRVDLKDAAGRTVRCHIAALTAADRLHNTAVCTPLDPLLTETRYTVHAVGTISEGRYIVDVPFDLSWAFRTAASAQVPPVAGIDH